MTRVRPVYDLVRAMGDKYFNRMRDVMLGDVPNPRIYGPVFEAQFNDKNMPHIKIGKPLRKVFKSEQIVLDWLPKSWNMSLHHGTWWSYHRLYDTICVYHKHKNAIIDNGVDIDDAYTYLMAHEVSHSIDRYVGRPSPFYIRNKDESTNNLVMICEEIIAHLTPMVFAEMAGDSSLSHRLFELSCGSVRFNHCGSARLLEEGLQHIGGISLPLTYIQALWLHFDGNMEKVREFIPEDLRKVLVLPPKNMFEYITMEMSARAAAGE